MSFKDQVKWSNWRIERGKVRAEINRLQRKKGYLDMKIWQVETKHWLENKKKKGKKAKL